MIGGFKEVTKYDIMFGKYQESSKDRMCKVLVCFEYIDYISI